MLSLAWLVWGCHANPDAYLEVHMRTDYQPLSEFLSVRVGTESAGTTRRAQIGGRYVTPGEELAHFEGLMPSDERTVTVELLRADQSVLASTRVLFEHRGDIILTVAITRDCASVDCSNANGVALRCLQGRCVDARCRTGDEIYCRDGGFSCDDTTCVPDMGSCASATCLANLCYRDTQNHNCPPGFVCTLDQGCVPAPNTDECQTSDDECHQDDDAEGCLLATCLTDLKTCLYSLAPNGTPPEGSACATKGWLCAQGVCLNPDACSNGVKDGDETDIDCGGSCAMCPLGGDCLLDTDCQSGVCDIKDSNTCEAANTCGNGKIEGLEQCDDGNLNAEDGCLDTCIPCRCNQTGPCQDDKVTTLNPGIPGEIGLGRFAAGQSFKAPISGRIFSFKTSAIGTNDPMRVTLHAGTNETSGIIHDQTFTLSSSSDEVHFDPAPAVTAGQTYMVYFHGWGPPTGGPYFSLYGVQRNVYADGSVIYYYGPDTGEDFVFTAEFMSCL